MGVTINKRKSSGDWYVWISHKSQRTSRNPQQIISILFIDHSQRIPVTASQLPYKQLVL